jgi:hypothetical protein
MKNSQKNFRILVVALVALFSVSFASAAPAGDNNGSVPVNVSYVGNANDAAIFELSFNNEKAAEFEIMITDKFSTIYYEKVKGIDQVRKFQFYNNDSNGGYVKDEITVLITNTATKEATSYKIMPNARVEKNSDLVAKF